MDAAKLNQLKQLIEQRNSDPSILSDPSLSFFRDYLLSIGCKLPPSAYKARESPHNKSIGDPSVEVTKENCDASQEAKARAMEANFDGKFVKAVEHLTQAILLNPTSAIMYATRDSVHIKMKKPNAAIQDANAPLEINPDSAEGYNYCDMAQAMLGQWEEAAKDLHLASKLDYDEMRDPSCEVTEENHDGSQEAKAEAMKAISDGKFEEAIEHLTQAILLNPTSAIMYAIRASVYIKMRNPNAAIRDANAALEINPDFAKGYKSRGMAWAMLGQREEAAKDLHLASKLDHDEEINAVLKKMGDPSCEAIEENHDASQKAKAQAMEAISDGKFEEAIEHLTQAILLNPTSAIMHATRASVYIKMKKPNAAIQDANAALEINPDSAKGYKSRGMARAMLGQWEEAAKDLHLASMLDCDEEISATLKKMGDPSCEVMEDNRDASQEAKALAMEAFSDGKFEEAIEHLTQAILLNPTSAIMYATRASVYIKMKKPNAAIQDANVALEFNPDSAKGYKSRGMAWAMLGQWEEASKDLHLASKLDHDEEINAVLKKVEPNVHRIEEQRRKIEWLRKEREDKKIEPERERRRAEAQAACEKAKKQEQPSSSRRAGGMPGGMPEGFSWGMPGAFSCSTPGRRHNVYCNNTSNDDPKLPAEFADFFKVYKG